MRALIAYHWPGNVRELENVLERGVLLAEPGGRIDVDTLSIMLEPDSREQAHVRPDGRLAVTGAPLIPDIERAPLLLADYEAALVGEALRRAGGNVADAARMLGMSRRQLDRSEEHTSELQSLMRISYAVFCLKRKNKAT